MSKILKNIILVIIVALGVNVSYKLYDNISSQQNNVVNNLNNEADINENKEKNIAKITKNNTKIDKEDYSVLVSSNVYNALLSLNEETKEISIKVLDDSSEVSNSNNYINFTDEDIKYLTENKDSLIKEFNESSLLTKYSLVTKMLKDYDTDITSGDIINLGLKYLSSI